MNGRKGNSREATKKETKRVAQAVKQGGSESMVQLAISAMTRGYRFRSPRVSLLPYMNFESICSVRRLVSRFFSLRFLPFCGVALLRAAPLSFPSLPLVFVNDSFFLIAAAPPSPPPPLLVEVARDAEPLSVLLPLLPPSPPPPPLLLPLPSADFILAMLLLLRALLDDDRLLPPPPLAAERPEAVAAAFKQPQRHHVCKHVSIWTKKGGERQGEKGREMVGLLRCASAPYPLECA